MDRHPRSRAGVFLIELIIVILFFAVSSVICVNLFVEAHRLSRESSELTAAALEVQNAAECLRSEQYGTRLQSLMGAERVAAGSYRVYYDKNWDRQDAAEGCAYRLEVFCTESGGLLDADIAVLRSTDGEAVCSLQTTTFLYEIRLNEGGDAA